MDSADTTQIHPMRGLLGCSHIQIETIHIQNLFDCENNWSDQQLNCAKIESDTCLWIFFQNILNIKKYYR